MLRMTFTPPGADPHHWEFDNLEDGLSAVEAELIEDAGGTQWDTYVRWALQLSSGSFRACRVLLWVLLRRQNPALVLADLNFPVSALVFEDTADEPAADEPEPEGKDEPADSTTSSP
jgi:hypothetical protein